MWEMGTDGLNKRLINECVLEMWEWSDSEGSLFSMPEFA